MSEPKYDEDIVNLGYLNKVINNETSKSGQTISKHYASKPNTPYYAGDTWIDGNILYTCINTRLIGLYNDSDWVTESGAKQEAERKNKTFLTQPSNYNVGDMWILQSDTDHRAGKKGEILITTAGRKEYDADDWINMLDYGTIRSINEVANNINDALERLKLSKDNGIVTIFYSNTIPNEMIIGDLWFVIETIDTYTKNNLYKYDGTSWQIITDNLSVVAFEEANQARLVEDGKIQSFYDVEMPDTGMSVGDIWINTDNKKLYRYNGTNWVPVYDTRINEIRKSVESVSETMVEISTDLGQIKQTVANHTETITKLGSTETAKGTELNIDASKNPAHIKIWGKTEQATSTTGKNKFTGNKINSGSALGIAYSFDNSILKINGTTTSAGNIFLDFTGETLKAGTYTYSIRTKSGTFNVPSSSDIALYLRDQDNNFITGNYQTSGITLRDLMTTGNKSKSFTITEDIENLEFQLFTNAKDIVITNLELEIQIEPGNTVSAFEQFIPTMPSPNYPSRIRNIGDNINLIDLNTYFENAKLVKCTKELLDNGIRIKFTAGADAYLNEAIVSGGIVSDTSKATCIKVKPNTTYTLKMSSTPKCYISYLDKNYKSFGYSQISKSIYTFTTNSSTYYIYLRLGYQSSTSGLTSYDFTDIKLEEGSTATSFTEYGCGSINYKAENENKFSSDLEIGDINNTTGLNASNGNGIRTKDYIKLKPNTTYTIKNSNNYMNVVYFYTTDKTFINYSYSTDTSYTFTTGTKVEYIRVRSSSANIQNDLTTKYMLVEGSIAKPYVEHQEQTIHFPLSEGQLLHEGDYLASDEIHQNRKTYIFTGTEEIELWGNGTDSAYRMVYKGLVSETKKSGLILSNYYSMKLPTQLYEFVEGIAIDTNGYIIIHDEKYSTVANLKEHLAEQYANGTPVIVEYELAEEIITPLTPTQQKVIDNIETFKGQNYISCIDEIVPEKIEMEYYPNTPFNDTLVNKDTFDKVTSDMSAQINIKANEVETSVKESTTASILTLLNNGYLTAEQVNALVNGNAEDIAVVKEQLKQTITSSQMQIEITKALEGGVSYLKNTLFTIDDKGMAIATNQDEFNALYNNKGMYLYSFEQLIAKFDVNGATLNNLKILGEVETENLRMMNVSVSGVTHTHIHWIGG